jgi:hypothetical protein
MRSRVHNRNRDRGGRPIQLAWLWAIALGPSGGTGGGLSKKSPLTGKAALIYEYTPGAIDGPGDRGYTGATGCLFQVSRSRYSLFYIHVRNEPPVGHSLLKVFEHARLAGTLIASDSPNSARYSPSPLSPSIMMRFSPPLFRARADGEHQLLNRTSEAALAASWRHSSIPPLRRPLPEARSSEPSPSRHRQLRDNVGGDKVASGTLMYTTMLRRSYLSKKLTRPLTTKDGGTLCRVLDVRRYMLRLSKERETARRWQRAADLLREQADIGALGNQVQLALFYDRELDLTA